MLTLEKLEPRCLLAGVDVNGDGAVEPADVLEVVNAINQGTAYQESYDVNGDQIVSAVDPLLVINVVNNKVCSTSPLVTFNVVPAAVKIGETQLATVEYVVLNGCQAVPTELRIEVLSEVADPTWSGVTFAKPADVWNAPEYIKLNGVIGGLSGGLGWEQYVFPLTLTGQGSLGLTAQIPKDAPRLLVRASWVVKVHEEFWSQYDETGWFDVQV